MCRVRGSIDGYLALLKTESSKSQVQDSLGLSLRTSVGTLPLLWRYWASKQRQSRLKLKLRIKSKHHKTNAGAFHKASQTSQSIWICKERLWQLVYRQSSKSQGKHPSYYQAWCWCYDDLKPWGWSWWAKTKSTYGEPRLQRVLFLIWF